MGQDLRTNIVAGFYSVLFSFVILLPILFLIADNYVSVTCDPEIIKLFAIDKDAFHHESLEKLLFITYITGFPILLTLFSYIFRSKPFKIFQDKTLSKDYNIVSISIITLITVLLLFISVDKQLFFARHHVFNFSAPLVFLAAAVSFGLYKLVSARNNLFLKNKLLRNILNFLSCISLLMVLIYGIFEIKISDFTIYVEHFNSMFYSVVQTFYGKGLLVDFTNQYGLYPLFLLPVFKIIGLSVVKYSFVMSCLTALSFASIFLFLNKIIKNKFLVFFGISTILFLNHFITELYPYPNVFSAFMVRPLRLLFPALSVYLVYSYLKTVKFKKFLYNFQFLIYSFGLFWNFETGFVVFLAWMLLLFYKEFCQNNLKPAIKNNLFHLLRAVGYFTVVFIFINVIMHILYGKFPDFIKFFEYQKYFYLLGIGMMPMQIIHPWNLVVIVYVVGLTKTIQELIQRKSSIKTSVVFYLSVLGIGIFSYYQGRSHDLNLLNVIYPAILLLVIFVDGLTSLIKRNNADIYHKTVFVVIITTFVFSTASFYSYYPKIFKIISFNMLDIRHHKDSSARQYSDFINKYADKNKKIVFLSYNSGYYYLAAKTSSPVNIPGLNELFLKEDIKKLENFLQNQKNVIVFLDKNFVTMNRFEKTYLQDIMGIVNKSYKKIDMTDDSNLAVYTRY